MPAGRPLCQLHSSARSGACLAAGHSVFRPWTLHNMWLFSQRGRLLPGSEPAGSWRRRHGYRPVDDRRMATSPPVVGHLRLRGYLPPRLHDGQDRVARRRLLHACHAFCATHAGSADGRSSVCDMSCVLHTTTIPDDTFAADLPPCIVVSVLGALKGNLSWLASLRYMAI